MVCPIICRRSIHVNMLHQAYLWPKKSQRGKALAVTRAKRQSFLITMLGNLLVMSFAFSATFTATLRAICL